MYWLTIKLSFNKMNPAKKTIRWWSLLFSKDHNLCLLIPIVRSVIKARTHPKMRNNPFYGHLNGTMITIRRILRYFTDLDFQDNLPKQKKIWPSKSAHENPSKPPISTGCSKVVLLSPSWQPLVPAHSTPPAHRRRRKRTAAAGLRGWVPGLAGQGRYKYT